VVVFIKTFLSFAENTTTSVSTYGGATSASGGQNSPQAAAYPLLAEVVAVSATRADSSTFEKLTKLTNT
jgi:hypothetical protein